MTWAGVAAGWWQSSEMDDYAALSAACLQSRERPLGVLPVAFIGSSASREALINTQAVAIQLGRTLSLPPHEVGVRALFAGDLRPVEMLALSDCLPQEYDGLVVLSVSPQALSEPPEERRRLLHAPRLATRSSLQRAWAEAQGEALRAPTGWPLVDAPGFFLARPEVLLNLYAGEAPEPAFHQVENLEDPSPQAWRELIVPRLRAWVPAYPAHSPDNLALYADLIAELQARGAVVVLQDAPRNPKVMDQALGDAAGRAALDTYEADVVALSEKSGAYFVQPQRQAQLPAGAFKDHSHVYEQSAREAWTQSVVAALAGALEAEGWRPSREVGPPPGELPLTPPPGGPPLAAPHGLHPADPPPGPTDPPAGPPPGGEGAP